MCPIDQDCSTLTASGGSYTGSSRKAWKACNHTGQQLPPTLARAAKVPPAASSCQYSLCWPEQGWRAQACSSPWAPGSRFPGLHAPQPGLIRGGFGCSGGRGCLSGSPEHKIMALRDTPRIITRQQIEGPACRCRRLLQDCRCLVPNLALARLRGAGQRQ
jgi:hypothetical protein